MLLFTDPLYPWYINPLPTVYWPTYLWYTTARMDYAISARPSRTRIVIRGKSRWTQKWTAKKNQKNITCSYILIFVSVCFLNASLSRTCWVLNGVYFIVNFIFVFICNTWLTWFFLKQHLLHDIVVGFIFKVMAQELLVFEWFLHIVYLLVPPQWTVGTQR
jgi:hypothetical protein